MKDAYDAMRQVKTRAVFGVRRLDAAFLTTQCACVEEKSGVKPPHSKEKHPAINRVSASPDALNYFLRA